MVYQKHLHVVQSADDKGKDEGKFAARLVLVAGILSIIGACLSTLAAWIALKDLDKPATNQTMTQITMPCNYY